MKQNFKAWLAKLRTSHNESKAHKKAELLAQLSCERINVTEFNGNIYVSYDGVPIIKTDNLNAPVTKLLEESRKEYLLWKEKFDR